MLETNAGIAAFLQTAQLFDLGLDYDRRLPELLGTVTRDQVCQAAQRTLSPERAAIVIAGPHGSAGADDSARPPAEASVGQNGSGSPYLMTKAVFFDVDFTLIYPGPMFGGEGYRRFGARHGLRLDPSRLGRAVTHASALLDRAQEGIYDPALFVAYARHVLEQMGGEGTEPRRLRSRDLRGVGRLSAFPALRGCGARVTRDSRARRSGRADLEHASVSVRVSESFRVGWLDRRRRVFLRARIHEAASEYLRGRVAPRRRRGWVTPSWVGDSVKQDIDGARQVGMRAILLARAGTPAEPLDGIPVIRSLTELPAQL